MQTFPIKRRSAIAGALLLGIASGELGHHAALLPKLNVGAVDNLLGGLNRGGGVRAMEIKWRFGNGRRDR
jgi:hypothetical protein